MAQLLRWCCAFRPGCSFLLFFSFSGPLLAQTLSTQPLTVTSVCPGAQLDVTGLRTAAGEGYAIELSPDGTIYTEIPSVLVSASGRYEVTFRATIPANTAPGTAYRVRITSKNPPATGSSSPSLLTVTPPPAAPGVTQKTLCQFAAPEAVSATGENLTWYNLDGNKFGSAPVIGTDKPQSFSLLVSQTVNGCESPKATLSVNIVGTPTPTVAQATVSLCQGGTAQPLAATGENLKWIDPAGNVTTTPPTPGSQKPATSPDGDVYYVTQTTNGCESPRVAIRVFIQTLPTLSVTAPATINLGLEVPLKLTFTGAGPYQYKLSNGLTGTATKDTTILVLPTQTTTYQVTEVSNKCGMGQPGSSPAITVAVQVPTIQTLSLNSTTLCAGSNLTVAFTSLGTFNPGSVFKLQIAKAEGDSTKVPFTDVEALPATGHITGVIPGNTPAGAYWVRVVASNPKIPIVGFISPTRLTVRQLPAATLAGTQRIVEGQPASLSVILSGDGPWTFAYRDSSATGVGSAQTVTTSANPHALTVQPMKTTAYALTSVRNGCGVGTLAARTVVVTVDPLLGVEDPTLADAVSVYPVPASSVVTVRIDGLSAAQPTYVELIDGAGRPVNRQEMRQTTADMDVAAYPSGTYIIRIQVGERKASKRVLKL